MCEYVSVERAWGANLSAQQQLRNAALGYLGPEGVTAAIHTERCSVAIMHLGAYGVEVAVTGDMMPNDATTWVKFTLPNLGWVGENAPVLQQVGTVEPVYKRVEVYELSTSTITEVPIAGETESGIAIEPFNEDYAREIVEIINREVAKDGESWARTVGRVIKYDNLPQAVQQDSRLIVLPLSSGSTVCPQFQFNRRTDPESEITVNPYVSYAWELMRTLYCEQLGDGKWFALAYLGNNRHIPKMAACLKDPSVPLWDKHTIFQEIVNEAEQRAQNEGVELDYTGILLTPDFE